MEAEDSEIPVLKHATDQNDVVRAYHCCQEDMCNDQGHAAASARTVQEALATVIKSSMSQLREEHPVVTAASSEPPSTSHPAAEDNAIINGAKPAQTEKVPEDSSSAAATATAPPTSVAPSATDSPAADIVATTPDLVGDENATPAPVTAGSVDYNSKIVSGDVAVVSHDTTVAVSTSTEHVPSTSTVYSTTEVPLTTVDSSGNVTDVATQSTTTIATTTAEAAAVAAAAVMDGFATGNGLTTNLISETTAPVVIAETSTIEIATTTKGSVEQETPIADASNAVRVVLTHDKGT